MDSRRFISKAPTCGLPARLNPRKRKARKAPRSRIRRLKAQNIASRSPSQSRPVGMQSIPISLVKASMAPF